MMSHLLFLRKLRVMNYFERLKYYDFEVHKEIYYREEKYQRVQIKLPAYDVKSAIIQFLIMMDPPHFIYWPNCFGAVTLLNDTHTHRKVDFLFRQVREYELSKTRFWSIHQYKLLKVYNRHDFVPLFKDEYNLKGGKYLIKKGTNGR